MSARRPDRTAATWRRATASPWCLVAILLVAAGVRIAYLVELQATPWWDRLIVDPEYYDAWARRLAGGDWLGERAFYMDPLYPYVLGVLYRVAGHDRWSARLLNVACSVGTCACTAALGRRVGGPAVGALAALGFALYEPDVFFAGEIDKTSLSTLLVAAALVLAFRRGLRARVATGFVVGLAALT